MEKLVGGGRPTCIHRLTRLEWVKWSQPSSCLANCCHLEIRGEEYLSLYSLQNPLKLRDNKDCVQAHTSLAWQSLESNPPAMVVTAV